MLEPSERLIIALDVDSKDQALKLCDTIGDAVSFYKIGLQLFIAEGRDVIEALKERGKRIFLDLKLHDIPHQAANACREIVRMGVDMTTIHTAGGAEMMQAVVRSAESAAKEFAVEAPEILGVTVLTSLNQISAGEIGVSGPLEEQVLRLASLAQRSGLGGIVASPHEVAGLRALLGDAVTIVTPGIRGAKDVVGDQKRTMSAAEAIRIGSTYIVVGRPVTAVEDPRAAAENLLKELQQV